MIEVLESQEPVAWQWLGSAHFRKKIPKNADITAWNPLYHYPQKLEQKIVAWGVFEGNLHDMFFTQEEAQEMARLKGSHAEAKPLYTYPPQRTEQEPVIKQGWDVDTLLDKLEAQPAPTAQEPLAWVNQSAIDWLNGNMQGSNEYVQTNLAKRKNNSATVPIFTHPPQRTWVGLTPEEILDVFDAKNVYGSKWLEFAKAVENKSKEKNT